MANEPAPVVNLHQAFERFDEHWSPRIVATVNDYQAKIVKVEGEFVEHAHADTDELFLVLAGSLTIRLPELGSEVTLAEGELYVVPEGVVHQPIARPGTRLLLLEPTGTVNTGDARRRTGEAAPHGTAGIEI